MDNMDNMDNMNNMLVEICQAFDSDSTVDLHNSQLAYKLLDVLHQLILLYRVSRK